MILANIKKQKVIVTSSIVYLCYLSPVGPLILLSDFLKIFMSVNSLGAGEM